MRILTMHPPAQRPNLSWILFSLSLMLVSSVSLVTAESLDSLALVHESYDENNWELFLSGADGTSQQNLTNTKDQHELYPQVSPDGKHVCFVADVGSGRKTVRSVWVMDIDGKNRRKIADHARQPCWHPDSQTIAYLPQEFKKFNIVDYFTKGVVYHNIKTGKSRTHPNNEKLHHLYNPSFAGNGNWIAATVHAGMGHGHAGLLVEAEGQRIIDLGIKGCRPCLNADNRHIAWGEDDHTVVIAELDLTAAEPKIGKRLLEIHDAKNKIYHVDWSPQGGFVSVSRGPNGKGDPSKPGTHEAACEMVGIYAKDWDLFVVPIEGQSKVDLGEKTGEFVQVTRNGKSNKESDWVSISP